MRLKDLVKGVIIIAMIFILPENINAELICQSNVPDSNKINIKDLEIKGTEKIKFASQLEYEDLEDDSTNIKISDYFIDINVDEDLLLSAKCRIVINNKWKKKKIKINLNDSARMDTIYNSSGVNLTWYKNTSAFDIYLPDSLLVEKDTIIFHYSYNAFFNNEFEWTTLINSIDWYPQLFYPNKALFDLKFSIPEKYKLASVGEKLSEEVIDSERHYHWKTSTPQYFASFNMSNYKEIEYQEEGYPDLTIFMNNLGHNTIYEGWYTYDLAPNGTMEGDIAGDMYSSISFYTNLFGKLPYKKLYAAEVPTLYGLAFPGVILYSWITFVTEDYYGITNRMYRAHEVAHQWWGIGVMTSRGNDLWLSEGLAEFSSLWFVQAYDNDSENYFERLKEIREEIIDSYEAEDENHYLGSVELGWSNEFLDIEGGARLLLYQKSAYIFHMIRTMLIDLKTMNEDLFQKLMRQYYEHYNGKIITTKEFQKYLSDFFMEDISWFFDQWIHSGTIPKIKFAYKYEEQDDGRYKVFIKVKQSGFGNKFKAYVPVSLIFDEDKYARFRITLTGEETNFAFPNLPEPTEFIFNEFEGLLCIQEEVDWDDFE